MPEQQGPATRGEKRGARALRETVGRKEERKLRARRDRGRGPWFWAGMMGLVGWSVTMPMLIGALVGRWIDGRWPGRASWTLTLLVAGAALGCLTAWYWVKQESGRE